MKLVTPGHIWSQLVTNCSLVKGGHIGNTLSLSNSIRKEMSVRTESRTLAAYCIDQRDSCVGLHAAINLKQCKGPFKNDVSREGEGGGYPKSDAVREVA